MNKSKNGIRTFLIFAVSVILFALVVVLYVVWYQTFDVTGLTFYQNEPIEKIFLVDDRVYLITENGNGYVAGNYSSSKDRKYRNSEFRINDKLGTPSPVLFFDGNIVDIIACNYGNILFVDDKNVLYELNDFTVKKICEDVLQATKSNTTEKIYFVDKLGRLFSSSERDYCLASNVKMVKAYRETLFVLFNDGNLCKLTGNNCSETIFTNVKSFDVVDTSERIFDGENVVADYLPAIENPLFNVLTNDGELYARGYYNLIYKRLTNSSKHAPYVLEDWTIIGEDVVDYSLAGMGSLMILNDSTCKYFGFDTSFEEGSKVSERVFDDTDVISVCETDCAVCYQTDEGFYFLGNELSLFFDTCGDSRVCDKHNILSGEAYFLKR